MKYEKPKIEELTKITRACSAGVVVTDLMLHEVKQWWRYGLWEIPFPIFISPK